MVVTDEQNMFVPSCSFSKLQVVELNQIARLGAVYSSAQGPGTRVSPVLDRQWMQDDKRIWRQPRVSSTLSVVGVPAR